MFLLIKDRLTKQYANVKIFVHEKRLSDRTCVVKHWNRNRDFVFWYFFFFWWRLSIQSFLYFDNASVDVIKSLEKEVLHVLSVWLDNNTNVSVMLFKLSEVETPIDMNYLQSIWVLLLEKHIGFVVDVVSGQECFEGFLEM